MAFIEDHVLAVPLDQIETHDSYLPSTMFVFYINAVIARRGYYCYDQEHREFDNYYEDAVDGNEYLDYNVVMDENHESSEVVIHHMLSNLGVPVRPFVAQNILDAARSMSKDQHYAGRKVLRMFVEVFAWLGNNDDDVVMGSDGDGDDGKWESRFEPACRACNEELERVEVV